MKSGIALLLLAAAASGASIPAKVTRVSIVAAEESIDKRIGRINVEEPMYVLGPPRGIYLDGYGAVFTAELNLVASAVVSPFRPAYTKDEVAKLKQKKLQRLAVLKVAMKDMLLSAAPLLEGMSPDEQVVVAVNLFYFSWEDSAGLPTQVIMQAPKKGLLHAAQAKSVAADSVIRVQEY
jgi:hypothetical protein